MKLENLDLGITIANSCESINVSEVYDELEERFESMPISISTDRIDNKTESGIHAGAIDFAAFIEIIHNISELIEIASLLWNIYNKYIEPQREEKPSIFLYVIDRKNGLDFMLGQEYTEQTEFIEAFIKAIYENNKKDN